MKTQLRLFVVWVLLHTMMAYGGAIRELPGFTNTVFGANDDGTYPASGGDSGVPSGTPETVPIGFSVNFYGQTFTNVYINNNGNLTFDSPLGTFTPFGLVNTAHQIIAPYFADVDTRNANLVTFGNDTVDGHPAFGVNWIGVGYYNSEADKLNKFQVILISRSDRNAGDFDIEFNYDQVQWETGDASGGQGGLGGSSAVAGISNGSKQPGTSFQLAGSGIPRSFLDVNPAGLIYNFLNTNVPGRYIIPIVNLTNLVLNVERFAQNDPQWGGDLYGNTGRTIAEQGSALTCLAMALHYAGVATDPGELNTVLKADDDFEGSAVVWGPATRDSSAQTLQFHAHRSTDTRYLSQILALGCPVIVRVSNLMGGSHYVLVIGETNGQFVINDPGHANATSLATFNNDFETRGYVSSGTGDLSEFDLSAGDITRLLTVDPLGRRAGYDPSAVGIFEGIPQSVYFEENVENSDVTGAVGTQTAHLVDIYQPPPGIYQLYLLCTNSGSCQLSLRSFLADGTATASVALETNQAANTLTPYQVNLSPSGVAMQTFTNQYVWTASPTNGSLPLSVQFTGPNTDTAGHSVTNWYWSFANHAFDTQQSSYTTYTNAATFFPSVAGIDDAGNTVVSFGPAIVIPTVTYTAAPSIGAGPSLTVQFSTTNTDSTGSPVAGWIWDFGDGSGDTSQNPSHTYTTYGTFTPTLTATNSQGGAVYGIGPAITSLPAQIQNGGFEMDNFTGWTLVDSSGNTMVDDGTQSATVPHSGSYMAELETSGSSSSLSQNIFTIPGRPYLISLWLNIPDGIASNEEFAVRWNGASLFDQTNLPPFGWTNLQFAVMAGGNAGSLELDFVGGLRYLGLDDVSVVPMPITPPPLTITLCGCNAVLTWPTNGIAYTLRSTTDPFAPNWVTNAIPIIVNGQNTVTNPISSPQMFFQLIQ